MLEGTGEAARWSLGPDVRRLGGWKPEDALDGRAVQVGRQSLEGLLLIAEGEEDGDPSVREVGRVVRTARVAVGKPANGEDRRLGHPALLKDPAHSVGPVVAEVKVVVVEPPGGP